MSWAAVAGAAVSVVGSQLGKKSGSTNTVQSSDPWSGSVPYLSEGFKTAQGLLGGSFQRTGGIQDALRARSFGSPADNEAQNLAASTMRGDYLNSNPFLNNTVQDAMGMAKSQINSQFAGNNYGSSAHQEWLGKGLMNAAMPYMSQNYENERGRQYAAMAQAPSLQSMDYQNIGAMQQAENMPWDFLGRYQSIVNGTGGGTTNTQSPYFTNPVNSALGGAMLGNQLYNQYQQPSNANANWATQGSSTPFSGGFGWGNV